MMCEVMSILASAGLLSENRERLVRFDAQDRILVLDHLAIQPPEVVAHPCCAVLFGLVYGASDTEEVQIMFANVESIDNLKNFITQKTVNENDRHSKHPIIVMIAYSGFRPSYITGNIFEKFKSKSSSIPYLRNVFPTQTFPNFFSISTGMYPETHGVLSDEVFDDRHTECLSHSRPELYSYNPDITPIWVLNEKGGDDRHSGVMMWPASNYSYRGTRATFVEQLNTKMPWEKRIDTVLDWLTHPKTPANLVLVYFEEPEATARQFGPHSDELRYQLMRINNITLYYVRQLRARKILDDVNTILLSDHGMTPVKHDAVTSLSKYVDANSSSWCGHSPILQIQPKNGSKIAVVLESLRKGADETDRFNVYERKDIPNRWHLKNNTRCPDILVVCKSGFVFTDAKDLVGMSGYDLSNGMSGFFMARGPLFKEDYSPEIPPEIRTIDIYPLIAQILDLKPPVKPNGSVENIQDILVNQENQTDEVYLFK